MKPSTAIAFAIGFASSIAIAATTAEAPQKNQMKAKIVSRLYEATYGARERCKHATPGAAAEFNLELTRFVRTKANLMKLLTHSPHYESARKQYAAHLVPDSARDTPEALAGECQYMASLLRSMIDTKEGNNAAKEYEALLSE